MLRALALPPTAWGSSEGGWFAFAAWQEWPPLGLGVVGASGALWAGSLLTKLGTETGYPQQPCRGLPQPLPTPGAWLLASQGPYVGTVMWPRAERSRCLFAEGGKTTCRLLIQPHLGAPGSAARVCPGCLGSDYARPVGVECEGAAGGLCAQARAGARLGGPIVPRETA